MAKIEEIAKIICLMQQTYPNYHPLEGTEDIFFECLRDLDSMLLRAAVLQCLSQPGRAFAPSIGEIRGAAAELIAQRSGLPPAYEAWEQIHQPRQFAVWYCGSYNAIRDSNIAYQAKIAALITHPCNDPDHCGQRITVSSPVHPLVERVARGLGWPDTFPAGSETEVADRAHFLHAYEQAVSAQVKEIAQLPMVRAYVEQGRALDAGQDIKRLAAKMAGKQ